MAFAQLICIPNALGIAAGRNKMNPEPYTLCCSFQVEQVLGFKPELYSLFNGLLLMLVALHIYWFAIICNIALQKVLKGKDIADARESED